MNASDSESFRDRVSTIDESGKRKWVFAYKPSGRFYNARSCLSILYLVLFFGLPLVKFQGEPYFLFNIIERKFVIFGFVFWSQDFYLFGITMILFIVFIIVFTVAFGRLFCGWACPQTVFMELVFRRIEYWIEGDANKQIKLNAMPWNWEKTRKKGLKTIVFFAVSFLIGNTFLAYIIGSDALFGIITDPVGTHIKGFLAMIVFSMVFFFVYLWFREQVCTIVCPYGRLQGVLLDKHSVLVAYDYVRGEPRGKHIKKSSNSSVGDCVDCGLCVRVCPTGIDIRNGTQLECTNCTACIDACDSIMDNLNKPRGLVKYASESTIKENQPFIITSRLKAYIAVLIVLLGIWVAILSTRNTVDMEVRKVSGQIYSKRPNGEISNIYNVMLLNKSHNDFDDLSLEIKRPNGARIEWVGLNGRLSSPVGQAVKYTFFVVINPSKLHERKSQVHLVLLNGTKVIETSETSFISPLNK
jgi:cytochrome c oxidase accessory protein FixG